MVILDLMMPERDGLEILDTVKSIHPDIRIIIYTGFQRYENSAYVKEADGFFLKGEDPEKLLQAIEKLLITG
jgi:DNA-binding NarL/FixJ family response regulator